MIPIENVEKSPNKEKNKNKDYQLCNIIIPILKEGNNKMSIIKSKPPGKMYFKKAGWASKIREKEKNIRTSKKMKNMVMDNQDVLTYNLWNKIFINKIDQSIEEGTYHPP